MFRIVIAFLATTAGIGMFLLALKVAEPDLTKLSPIDREVWEKCGPPVGDYKCAIYYRLKWKDEHENNGGHK